MDILTDVSDVCEASGTCVLDEGTFPNWKEVTQIRRQLWEAKCFV